MNEDTAWGSARTYCTHAMWVVTELQLLLAFCTIGRGTSHTAPVRSWVGAAAPPVPPSSPLHAPPLAPLQLAATATIGVDFAAQQRTVLKERSGLFNVVRHGALWGQAVSALDKDYASSFKRMGTEYVCVFLYDEIDEISPAPGEYNFTSLQNEIDDTLSMGFSPFIRFATPPKWVSPRNGSSGAHLAQQIEVIKSPQLRALFLGAVRGVISHLFSRYGAATRAWAFSILNEVGVYSPQLSNGNWDVGSKHMAVIYSEFAAAVKSVDRGLRPGGGLESTNSYEFAFFVEYLNRTGQTELLANASFLDHHHYGNYGNLTADLDSTLDNAKASNLNISTVRSILQERGLSHVEVWESERAFNADGWDYRCSNHTGGLFAALSIVSNCASGLDRAFHWVDYGSSGFKLWTTLPLQEAYYAPLLLHSVAKLGENSTFVAVRNTHNKSIDVYSWSQAAQQRAIVVAFNRRATLGVETFALTGLRSLSKPGERYLVTVFEYSARRTIDATTALATLTPTVTTASSTGGVATSTLHFEYTLEGYSFTTFVVAVVSDGDIDLTQRWPTAATTTAAAAAGAKKTTFNPRDFGAKGDGAADDYAAIHAAAAAATLEARRGAGGYATLEFTQGSYRIGSGTGRGVDTGGLQLTDALNVAVVFHSGAELLIDNLDQRGLGSQGHGVLISGNSSNITLQGVSVRWKVQPSGRSQGDGIRVLGVANVRTGGGPSNISIIDGQVVGAAQAGVIFMGVQDIIVRNLTVRDTLADGLHLNACRRITVDRLTSINTGDDGLAFVTYFQPEAPGALSPFGPFSSPNHTYSNDCEATLTNIFISGGSADGIRLAGATNVSIDGVQIVAKPIGVQIDSAVAGGQIGWTYLASRHISLRNISIRDCGVGLLVHSENVGLAAAGYHRDSLLNGSYTDFDVSITDVSIANSSQYQLYAENCSGFTVQGLLASESMGGLVLKQVSDFLLADVHATLARCGENECTWGLAVYGSSVPMAAEALDAQMPVVRVSLRNVTAVESGVLLQDIRGLEVHGLSSERSPGSGVMLVRVLDSALEDVTVLQPYRHRSGAPAPVRGLGVELGRRVTVTGLNITIDDAPIRSIELGGGVAAAVSEQVAISRAWYSSAERQAADDVLVQGGPFAPLHSSIELEFLSAASGPSAHWRQYSWPPGRR